MLFASAMTLALNTQLVRTESAPASPSEQEPPGIEWSDHYGWGKDEYASCVQQTTDGGYVVAGSTSSGSRGIDGMIFKTNSSGGWEWGWAYGGDGYDSFYSVQQTADGGYILGGTTDPIGSTPSNIWLLKTDGNGREVWETTLGDPQGEDSASCVAQTRDGGYIIAGKTGNLLVPFAYDFSLVKTSANGTLEWSKKFGAEGIDFADSAQQTADGGYIVAGTTNSFDSTDGWLIKTDAGGDFMWGQAYGNYDALDQFYSVQQTGDGGYIAAGSTNSSGRVKPDFWLVKINATSGIVWSKTFGGLDSEYAHSVQQTSDGGFVLAGPTYSPSAGSPDFFVVKTDVNGNAEWSQNYGTPDTDYATSVHETRDGGFIVAGYTYYSGGGSSTDTWLVKIDGDADNDGLADSWERNGIDCDKDGILDLNLSALKADWKHKDLFVEIDYMGSDGTHDHKPDPEAIEQVKTAFKNAPVKNPDNKDGITLHVEIDEEMQHADLFRVWTDYDAIRTGWFGNQTQRNSIQAISAKKLVYRYCLFIHSQQWFNTTSNAWEIEHSSGICEGSADPTGPANDFLVSLGGCPGGKGTTDEQAATFMHELGHALGLNHGGGDEINFKPNYLSIMNYAFQFPNFNRNRPLDYSRVKLPALNEASLNENAGIGAEVTGQPLMTVFSNRWGNASILSAGYLPIDWNQNGNDTDANVIANINNFRRWNEGTPGDEILTGYNDWENIRYGFQAADNFAEGSHGGRPIGELTWEDVEFMRESVKSTHDVAVVDIDIPEPVIVKGSSIDLNITLMNQGGNTEAFTVTVYANATSIASIDLTLERGNIAKIDLIGETAGFSEANYVLSAFATPVTGETDVADNRYTHGILTVTSSSSGWVEWSRSYTKTYGDDREFHDVAHSVCQTADGGFALAGETGYENGEFWLVKTYPNGSIEWDKTFGSGTIYYQDGAYSLQQTSEGGFIIAGYARPPQKKNSLWLLKTDSVGNAIWNKTYGGNSSYWSGDQWVVKQAKDGGYVACGDRRSQPPSGERSEMWLIRTDSAGKELWNKTYGATDWAQAYSVWQTADGGYILGGSTSSLESTYGAALLVKTDSLGNQQWSKTYANARIFSLQQTTDGGYILAGSISYSGPGDYGDFWLAKTDSNGNTQWNKTYSCTRLLDCWIEQANSVQQTKDGGYVLAGFAGSAGPANDEVWIVKTDEAGNVQADLTFGMGRRDCAYSVIETQDGAYVAAGSTEPAEHSAPYDFLLAEFRILIVIPEFPAWMIMPLLVVLTLATAALLRRRKLTYRSF